MPSSRADLHIDWCSYEAARFAVERWHYSRSMPPPPHNLLGVLENSRFVGVIIFSRAANRHLGAPYGLSATEVCELTRVALGSHETPVSRLLAIGMRFLTKRNPGLRLVVSFADPVQNHHGGIYQAGNWVYVGMSASSKSYRTIDGRKLHPRQVSPSGIKKQFGRYRRVPSPDQCEVVDQPGKHRYLMALDRAMHDRIEPLSKPYPKRAKQAMDGDQPSQRRGSADQHAPSSDGVSV